MQAMTKEILIGDMALEMFSLRYLAQKLHRSPFTIKNWEFLRLIPKPIVRTADGRRWYTQEEIELYHRLAEEEQIKNGKSFAKTKFTPRAFGEKELIRRNLEKHTGKIIRSRDNEKPSK